MRSLRRYAVIFATRTGRETAEPMPVVIEAEPEPDAPVPKKLTVVGGS